MPLAVRPMSREDINQIAAIDREAFPTQWPPPNYRHELSNQLARYVVAYCENNRTGSPNIKAAPGRGGILSRLAGWFGRGKKQYPPDEPNIFGFAGIWVLSDEAHVTNIAVRESHRRRGIGELLLINLIELAQKLRATNMTLEVRVSNTGAQSLYRKYGFAEVGVRKAYYLDNRENGLLMSTEDINTDSYQAFFRELKRAHAQKWGYTPPPAL